MKSHFLQVCSSEFHTSFHLLGLGMFSASARISGRISWLFSNFEYFVLNFLSSSSRCHRTLTWRWFDLVKLSLNKDHSILIDFWPWFFVFEDVSKYLDILTLGILNNLYPSVCWYGVSCLSIATRQSGNDIHYFCDCHLRRRRAMFSKDCAGFRVVFYNVTSKHDSSFVLLKCWSRFWAALPIYVHTSGHT